MELYRGSITAEQLERAVLNAPANQAYDSGVRAEYDRFWGSFQNNGNRVNYLRGFSTWPTECFKPKYDIKPTEDAQMLFTGAFGGGWSLSPVDLTKILEECGIVLDLSRVTNVSYAFYNAGITHIGVCDFRNATRFSEVFGVSTNLVTIDKILMPINQNSGALNWFANCSALENLVIEGEIKLNGMNLSECTKLTHASLISVINALQSKTSGTWTLTLGTTNLAKLTATEKAIATGKGWTLA